MKKICIVLCLAITVINNRAGINQKIIATIDEMSELGVLHAAAMSNKKTDIAELLFKNGAKTIDGNLQALTSTLATLANKKRQWV